MGPFTHGLQKRIKKRCIETNSNLLNITSEEVDRKVRHIISQYLRERRIYEKMKKSGVKKQFHAKWFGWTLMSFLRDRSKPRKYRQAGLPDTEVNMWFSKLY